MNWTVLILGIVVSTCVIESAQHAEAVTDFHDSIPCLFDLRYPFGVPEMRFRNDLQKLASATIRDIFVTHQSRTIIRRGSNTWNQERQLDISSDPISCFRLIRMIHMKVLVVTMQSLCFSSRTNSHRQTSVEDRVAGVSVSGCSIIIVCRLVDEYGEQF